MNNGKIKKYKIYFGLFGKKLVTTIEAKDREEAKAEILKRVTFYKIEETGEDSELDDLIQKINEFFK
jgi:hypothetical protein